MPSEKKPTNVESLNWEARTHETEQVAMELTLCLDVIARIDQL